MVWPRNVCPPTVFDFRFTDQWTVAYLGFKKEGAKFSLATSAHTKGGGAKPSFPIFLVCQKKLFLAKGGHGPMAPLNTPLSMDYVCLQNQDCDNQPSGFSFFMP